MTRLSDARWGRVGALGLLALLIAIVWVGPVNTYVDLIAAGSERLAQRDALLQRYRVLARGPVEPSAAAASPAGATLLFPDIPEAQAVALLQETVKGAATASRVQIRSLQVLRGELLGDARKMGVRIRAAGDVASLGQLLYAIENARPVLHPDNLQIQAPPPVAGGAAQGSLEFQFDVSGFLTGAGA